MPELQELNTIKDVCIYFKISRVTLWKLIKSGILVPIKIGKSKRFRKEDIEKYLESRVTQ